MVVASGVLLVALFYVVPFDLSVVESLAPKRLVYDQKVVVRPRLSRVLSVGMGRLHESVRPRRRSAQTVRSTS